MLFPMVEHRSKSKSCSVAPMGYQTAIFYYESANSHLLKSEKHGQQLPAKTDICFLLPHCRWGTFRKEERLRLSDRNSILMT